MKGVKIGRTAWLRWTKPRKRDNLGVLIQRAAVMLVAGRLEPKKSDASTKISAE